EALDLAAAVKGEDERPLVIEALARPLHAPALATEHDDVASFRDEDARFEVLEVNGRAQLGEELGGAGVAAAVAEVGDDLGAGRPPRYVLRDVFEDAGDVATPEGLEYRLDGTLVIFCAHPSTFFLGGCAFGA